MRRSIRPAHRAAFAASACFATVLAGSCVSVLDLGGYEGALGPLCELVRSCFGEERLPDCVAFEAARLRDADADARAAWLVYFADNHCLESCVNARRCIDEAPLCATRSEPCANDWHCCGFLDGSGNCDLDRGACCAPEGRPCGTAADCCGGVACEDGVCGGQPCKPGGASCVDGIECCTQVCNPETQACEGEVCLDNGAECLQNYQCCSGYCELPIPAGGPGGAAPLPPIGAGYCADPQCLVEQSVCDGVTPCCSGAACVTFPNTPDAYCWSQGCHFDGLPCTASEECCSGYCDPTYAACLPSAPCVEDGSTCASPYDCCSGFCDPTSSLCGCAPDGYSCTEYFQCCSGFCNLGLCGYVQSCLGAGSSCNGDAECCSNRCAGPMGCCDLPSCLHNVCQVGTALDPGCDDGCTAGGFICDPAAAGQCVSLVCAAHPECCCGGWDQPCIDAAKAECGIDACPTVNTP
ncbi:MAG: hypothetical protein HY908_02715 [Myxococcales bacterium]|nr:hypothetical protein [Myxococcales bacterium]